MLPYAISPSSSPFLIISNVFVLITVKEGPVSNSSSIKYPFRVISTKAGLDFHLNFDKYDINHQNLHFCSQLLLSLTIGWSFENSF